MTELDDIRKRTEGHAPGPWEHRRDRSTGESYVFASGSIIEDTAQPRTGLTKGTSELIAAAPDLLRIATEQAAELAEAREDLADLREQARMAGIWALLDPGERTAMLSWEQRNYADAAAYCAALQEAK